MMRGRRIALTFLGALLLLAAGAALVLKFRPPPAPGGDLQSTIDRVDAALAGGYLSTALEALAAIRVFPGSEEDLLRILKRAFEVASATGDYAPLARAAEKARAANSRSASVRAVAVYAFLRAGRLGDVEKALARSGMPREQGGLLEGETLLRRGRQWSGSDSITRDLMSLAGTEDVAAYAAAATRTADRRLLLDAALLAMKRGSRMDAADMVRTGLEAPAFDEPSAGILYDAGDFAGALEKLERLAAARPGSADLLLLMADARQKAGDAKGAEEALARAIALAPALSWTPYANLGLSALGRGDLEMAARRISDGLAFFPRARELLLARARTAAASGDKASAISVLAGLSAERPSDAEAALLLLAMEAPSLSPEEHRARLWKLFDRVPADDAACAALSAALVAAHDWEGAVIAAREHESAGGAPDAVQLLVKGVVAAMQGDDAGATHAFRRAASLERDGIARYDLALVLLRGGDSRAALVELGVAAEEVARNGDAGERGALRSRIEMLGATARLLGGDEQGARTALAKALALDPGNLRAGLLLRKLEAQHQQ